MSVANLKETRNEGDSKDQSKSYYDRVTVDENDARAFWVARKLLSRSVLLFGLQQPFVRIALMLLTA